MTRIIQFCVSTLQSRHRETTRKGGRPCSPFFSLLIVALLALPSFGHETEHHRVTEEILEEIQDLRNDIDELLNKTRDDDDDDDDDDDNGSDDPGYYYGALSQSLSGCGEDALIWFWYYDDTTSNQSARDTAESGCVAEGGDSSDCTTYTRSFGSAWGNGETYRCIALAAAGSLVSGTGSCATRTSWGTSETLARDGAMRACRNAGYSACDVVESICTPPRQ